MLFSSGSGGASVERVAQMEADSPPKLLVTTTSPGRKDSGMRHFYDPDGGLLRPTGHARFASGGNASAAASLDSAIIENVPDLRGLAVGASQTYQKKVLSPASSPPGLRHTTNIRETATFLGHQKVTTPAGTFDACKVRFVETDLDAGPDASSTERIYYFVPNLHWVRFESLNYVEELLSVAP